MALHRIRFRLGLCPRPCWESLQRSPRPLAGFKGPTSKGRVRERGEREGKGREGEGRGKGKEQGGGKEGREREGRKGKDTYRHLFPTSSPACRTVPRS